MQYEPLPTPDLALLRDAINRCVVEGVGLQLISCALAGIDTAAVLDLAFQALTLPDATVIANAVEAIEHVYWRGNAVVDLVPLNAALSNVALPYLEDDLFRANLVSLVATLSEQAERDQVGLAYKMQWPAQIVAIHGRPTRVS